MSEYRPTAKQEQAIREYLNEAVTPLLEQVLVKKLGQAMTFAADELLQPKKEWQSLTELEHTEIASACGCASADWVFYGLEVEKKVKEKNYDKR